MERDELELRLALRKEYIERMKADPLHLFQPFNKDSYRNSGAQAGFRTAVLLGRVLENWYIGSNRIGKTLTGASCGSELARYGDPNAPYVRAQGSEVEVKDKATSGWVVGLDSNAQRDIIQPKYFNNGFCTAQDNPFIPDREIVGDNREGEGWRVSDQVLKLKNGSIIGFKSCEAGAKKFQGAAKDWIHFDEEPPKQVYDECLIRVGKSNRPLRVFGTCTLLPPEGMVGGVSWIYNEIIKPVLEGKSSIGLYGATIYDNPHLSPDEMRRLEAKFPLDTIIGRIRLLGEYLPGLSGARAYPSFDRNLHIKPQDGHWNELRPLCWCLDFNVSPMVSIIGQREGRIYRVFQEIVLEQGSAQLMVEEFRRRFPHHNAEVWIYGDATGKKRTAQTGQSDYQVILNYMKDYGVPVVLKIPESNPVVPDRINAVQVKLKDETGQIRFEVDPDCEELITDLEQVLRDSTGGIKKTRNSRDPYFWRTHTSDALGYWMFFEEPVISIGAEDKMESTHYPDIPTPSYNATHE